MRALSSAWGFPGGDLQPPCGPDGARSRGVLGGLPPSLSNGEALDEFFMQVGEDEDEPCAASYLRLFSGAQ